MLFVSNVIRIIPPSYNIRDKQQLSKFTLNYLQNKDNPYILKNEQESARGILVTNNIDKMINHIRAKKQAGYPVTVIQQVIKSLLIHNHAFKIRMFLLIKCDKTGKKEFYLHKLGSIFYAPEKYNQYNINNRNTVANGYWYNNIEQTDYVSFVSDKPKTLTDLWVYLSNHMNIDVDKIQIKIRQILLLIFVVF